MKSPVSSVSRANVRPGIRPFGAGGPSDYASVIHRYLVSEATTTTLSDCVGSAILTPEAGRTLNLSAAGGGHPTQISLDFAGVGTNTGGMYAAPAEFTSDGTLAVVFAIKSKTDSTALRDMWERGSNQASVYVKWGDSLIIYSQLQSATFPYTEDTNWKTLAFYSDAKSDGSGSLRHWVNGSEITASVEDRTGDVATRQDWILGSDYRTLNSYVGDITFFDANAATAIADLLGEEAKIRARYVG